MDLGINAAEALVLICASRAPTLAEVYAWQDAHCVSADVHEAVRRIIRRAAEAMRQATLRFEEHE